MSFISLTTDSLRISLSRIRCDGERGDRTMTLGVMNDELKFLHDWQHGYPVIVSVIAVIIFFIFVLHAGIAVRKFPISWRQ